MLLTSDDRQRLVRLVATHAGLRLGDRDQAVAERALNQRLTQLRFLSAQPYLNLLAAQCSYLETPVGTVITYDSEWTALVTQLTIGESYFFRDQQQFRLLKNQLLPDRVQVASQNLATQTNGKSALRLWSAGCATGEEVYSLAMLWQELRGIGSEPGVQILGTDINPTFLAKARQGSYSSWSFRQTSPLIQQTYFQGAGPDRWQIRPELQQITQFETFNLALDPESRLTQRWGKFDLIICRNVFIYFTPAAIATTLRKFYNALQPGGYLITGHAELQGIDLTPFQTQRYPESVVYQRAAIGAAAGIMSVNPAPARSSPSPIQLPSPRPSPSRPSARFSRRVNRPARSVPPAVTPLDPAPPAAAPTPDANAASPLPLAALAAVQALADQGEYGQAYAQGLALVQEQPLNPEPCYLLATIAEAQEDVEAAKRWLKRVIYLDPGAVLAHLELAALYERSGDRDRAQKIRKSLLSVLQTYADDQVLPIDAGITVAELRSSLRALA